MAAPGEHEYEKQCLMKRLLDAVKQCQIRFGGKTELATEIDSRVSCLCSAWEGIVQHGMKHANRTLSALKQMTEMAGLSRIRLLEDVKNMETEPAFWQYIKQHLSAHELQRYSRLRNVNTDAGRGRAWIRAALNEHALERYMHMLIEDDRLLCAFYEDWAFLRDAENRHVLPNAAAGLNSVLFAISIDNPELNAIRPARGLEDFMSSASDAFSSTPPSGYVPGTLEPRPVIGGNDVIIEKRKDKKKKKKVPKIVSFDEAITESTSNPTTTYSTFTSASLPCTPGLSTQAKFDTFSVSTSSDIARSYSSESSSSSHKNDENTQSCVMQNNSKTSSGTQPHISSTNKLAVNTTYPLADNVVKTNKENTSASKSTASSLSGFDGKTVKTPHSSASLVRVASKSSLDSVQSAKSSKSEQSFPVKDVPVPNSSHVKGHKKSLSDTSMFSNIGSKLFKSVLAVSKRKFSSEDVNVESSQNDEDSAQNDTMNSAPDLQNDSVNSVPNLNRRSSIGSFDNVSLADINKITVANEDDQLSNHSNHSASRLPTLGASNPDTTQQLSSQPHSVQPIKDAKSDKGIKNKTTTKEGPSSKRLIHQSLSTSALSNKSDSSKGMTSYSIYGDDYEDSSMVPVASDGQLLSDSGFRTDVNDMLGSSPGGSADYGSNSIDFGNYMENTQQASLAIALAQQSFLSSETMRTQGDGSHFPDPVKPSMTSQDSMTTGELKEAIIAMMKRKDEVDEENRHLRLALEGELEVSSTLRLELDEEKKSHHAQQERDNKRIKDISRENELLKHQLRKYVGAVQMLRQKGASDQDFPGLHLDEVQPAVPPLNINTDFIQEASDYEAKLIQVAEMHGELMEFNEFLQKQLIAKDALIKDLRQELVDLRGPLPENMPQAGDDWSIISEVDGPSGSRPLVNIWIPAAFLKGKASQSFHVYQVYIRIRDEEWNVYRRYAEFHELHQFLKRRNPIVNTFDFPKKKAIGHKDEKFVEQRRRQLQAYVRKVINMIVHINTSLSVEINRHKLTSTVPFFGDMPEKKTETRRPSQQANKRRSNTTRAQSVSEPHYSGL